MLDVLGLIHAKDLLIELVDFQSLLALVGLQDKALHIIVILLERHLFIFDLCMQAACLVTVHL